MRLDSLGEGYTQQDLEKIIVRGKSEAPDGFSANWNCKEYAYETECPEYYEVEFRP